MTEFYILFQGDTEEDCINDKNKLGRTNIRRIIKLDKSEKPKNEKIFECLDGFYILQKLINEEKIKLLETIKIIDSTKKHYTIEEFFEVVFKQEKIK